MQTLRELVRELIDQFALDGRSVFYAFSPQLILYLALVVPALMGLALYQLRRYRLAAPTG